MKNILAAILLLIFLSPLSACNEKKEAAKEETAQSPAAAGTPAQRTAPAPKHTATLQDSWWGRWAGPEGTSLTLGKKRDLYVIQIVNLDGSKFYTGAVDGNRIKFRRGNVDEYISATDGKGTGMKWLADKKNCLVIKPGEGFCKQ